MRVPPRIRRSRSMRRRSGSHLDVGIRMDRRTGARRRIRARRRMIRLRWAALGRCSDSPRSVRCRRNTNLPRNASWRRRRHRRAGCEAHGRCHRGRRRFLPCRYALPHLDRLRTRRHHRVSRIRRGKPSMRRGRSAARRSLAQALVAALRLALGVKRARGGRCPGGPAACDAVGEETHEVWLAVGVVVAGAVFTAGRGARGCGAYQARDALEIFDARVPRGCRAGGQAVARGRRSAANESRFAAAIPLACVARAANRRAGAGKARITVVARVAQEPRSTQLVVVARAAHLERLCPDAHVGDGRVGREPRAHEIVVARRLIGHRAVVALTRRTARRDGKRRQGDDEGKQAKAHTPP
jgi:hypothetical protein